MPRFVLLWKNKRKNGTSLVSFGLEYHIYNIIQDYVVNVNWKKTQRERDRDEDKVCGWVLDHLQSNCSEYLFPAIGLYAHRLTIWTQENRCVCVCVYTHS